MDDVGKTLQWYKLLTGGVHVRIVTQKKLIRASKSLSAYLGGSCWIQYLCQSLFLEMASTSVLRLQVQSQGAHWLANEQEQTSR